MLDHLERPAGPLELGDDLVADRDAVGRARGAPAPRRRTARPRRRRRSGRRRAPSASELAAADARRSGRRPRSSDVSIRAREVADLAAGTARRRGSWRGAGRPVAGRRRKPAPRTTNASDGRTRSGCSSTCSPRPAAQPARARSAASSAGADLEQVADDDQVGELGDRRVRVAVDRDDRLGGLHPDLVLDRAADPEREVERRLHDLAGLADLLGVRDPARVDRGPGRPDRAAERRRPAPRRARSRPARRRRGRRRR